MSIDLLVWQSGLVQAADRGRTTMVQAARLRHEVGAKAGRPPGGSPRPTGLRWSFVARRLQPSAQLVRPSILDRHGDIQRYACSVDGRVSPLFHAQGSVASSGAREGVGAATRHSASRSSCRCWSRRTARKVPPRQRLRWTRAHTTVAVPGPPLFGTRGTCQAVPEKGRRFPLPSTIWSQQVGRE